MLKALWAVLAGGSIMEWLAIAAIAATLLAASFASGALWQASRDVRTAVQATPAAVAAQHSHDVQQHTVAANTDVTVKSDDAARDKRLDAVLLALASKPSPPEKTCDMPSDVVQLLNDAAH